MSQDFEDFKIALAKGSGRSMLLMRRATDLGPFEDALVHACLHELAYDRQCEHERSEYLARLVIETGDQERIFAKLAARIKDQDVDAPLLFTVLARLAAKNGETEKSVVRQAYSDLDHEAQLDCMDALVRLDGLPALIQYAALLAGDLEDEGWRAGGLLDVVREGGEADIESKLSSARAEHPSLEKLMAHFEVTSHVEPDVDKPYDILAIRAELRDGKRPRGVNVKKLSDPDWSSICEDFLLQEQDELALPYLTLFGRRPFSGSPDELARWTQSSNSRVSRLATQALGRIKSSIVRDMALQQIQAGKPSGVRLLASNYESGDLDNILHMLRDLSDEDEVHDLGLAILNLTAENDVPVEESGALLTLLYERTPCSMCRSDAVSRLFTAGQVPGWIADECRFDSDPDTVKLFAAESGD